MKENSSYIRYAAIWGLITGFVESVFTLLAYFGGDMSNKTYSNLSFLIGIALFIFSLYYYRKSFATTAFTYGAGVKLGFFVALFKGLFTGAVIFALFTFDAELIDIQIKLQQQELLKTGMPASQVAEGTKLVKEMMTPGFLYFTTTIGAVFNGLILSLLAMIFLRQRQEFSDIMNDI